MKTSILKAYYLITGVLLLTLLLNSCMCSKSSRVYHDTPADKLYFVEFGLADTFQTSGGETTIITYGDLDCSWGEYNEEYYDCEYRRFEYCRQFGNVISGEESLTNAIYSSPGSGSGFSMQIDSLSLYPSIGNNSNNPDISKSRPDTITIIGVQYENVYKYERINSPESAIQWVLFNLENRIIQVKMTSGVIWNRKP